MPTLYPAPTINTGSHDAFGAYSFFSPPGTSNFAFDNIGFSLRLADCSFYDTMSSRQEVNIARPYTAFTVTGLTRWSVINSATINVSIRNSVGTVSTIPVKMAGHLGGGATPTLPTTWNAIYNAPNGQHYNSPATQTLTGITGGYGSKGFDVTDIVQSQVNAQTYSSDLMMFYYLRANIGTEETNMDFQSSESASGPALVIDYTTTLPNKQLVPIQPSTGGVDLDPESVILQWNPVFATTSHDLYFGTDADPSGNFIANYATEGAPPPYDPGTLESGTTYYWRVDTKNDAGTTTGTVWSFTTAAGRLPDKTPYRFS